MLAHKTDGIQRTTSLYAGVLQTCKFINILISFLFHDHSTFLSCMYEKLKYFVLPTSVFFFNRYEKFIYYAYFLYSVGYAVYVVLLTNMCELLQAWKNMLEELENTAKLIKQNADSVETKSLDKLNSLYAEKRRARKQYQEEHNRIVAQFTHVSSYFTLLIIIYSRCLHSR